MLRCAFAFCLAFVSLLPALAQSTDTPDVENVAEMTFDSYEYDFGTVEQGEKVSYVFKFVNSGSVPLIIVAAKGSCGCTVPYFPKAPIMPGERSEIEVEFDSDGKKGMQHKRVSIVANTAPATTMLSLKGNIEVKEGSDDALDEAEAQMEKEKETLKSYNDNCFAIFPNPSNEFVQLELKEHIGMPAMVTFRNETGQQVMQEKVARISRESTRFDVSELRTGIYMITIEVDGERPMTQCFVVTGH